MGSSDSMTARSRFMLSRNGPGISRTTGAAPAASEDTTAISIIIDCFI